MTSDRPLLGVSTLVRNVDRVLLIRRGKAPFRGMWSLPGGHVERGERLAEAAAREVMEETGIAVSQLRRIDVTEILTDAHHYVLVVFAAESDREPHAASDAKDARWFLPSEMDHLAITEDARALIRRHLGEAAGA